MEKVVSFKKYFIISRYKFTKLKKLISQTD